MYGGRNTEGHPFLKYAPVKGDVLTLYVKLGIFIIAVYHYKHRHGYLGYYRGPCRAPYAIGQYHHKQYIQHNIQCRRYKHCVKGQLGIAYRPEKRRINIVYREERNAYEYNTKILV